MIDRESHRRGRRSGASRRLAGGFALLAALLATAGHAQNLGFSNAKALNSGANTDTFTDLAPTVATDRDGTWIAAWSSTNWLAGTIGNDRDILFARSTNNGASWTNAAALNSAAASDTAADNLPSLAADHDGDGVWIAAWEATGDILFARSTDGGQTWSAQATIGGGTLAGADSTAQVVCDGADTWIVLWKSSDTLGGTIGSDTDILFVRSTDDGATWSDVAPLNANAPDESRADSEPVLAAGGAGRWVAVWSVQGAFGSDVDLLFARSTDDGATWSAPAPLNHDAATDNESDAQPTIATDGAGTWAVAWVAGYPRGVRPTDADIMVARSTDDGATWSAYAPLNPNAPGDGGTDSQPRLACTGRGQWLAVWVSTESFGGRLGSDQDVLASRGLGDADFWTHPVPVANVARTDSGADFSPVAAGNGAGAWVAVWSSLDSLGNTIGTDDDILTAASAGLNLRMGGPIVR